MRRREPSPVTVRGATSHVDTLPADTIPIGILPELGAVPPNVLALEDGDIVALLTDGFYEWAREDAEQFGDKRVAKVIQDNKHRSADEILKQILLAVESFADTPQEDDLTAIIIKRTAGSG